MVMHIEDGQYLLEQGRKNVGKLVVTGGVEYWFLATKIPKGAEATSGVYLAPAAAGSTDPTGKLRGAESVETVFVYNGAAPADFGPATIDTLAAENTEPRVIKATCTSLGRTMFSARLPLAQFPSPVAQIDWGVYRIYQQDKIVGVVSVTPKTNRLPLERWTLLLAGFPSDGSYAAYSAPNAFGGAYTISYVGPSEVKSASDLVPSGITYETIEADCDAITLSAAP